LYIVTLWSFIATVHIFQQTPSFVLAIGPSAESV